MPSPPLQTALQLRLMVNFYRWLKATQQRGEESSSALAIIMSNGAKSHDSTPRVSFILDPHRHSDHEEHRGSRRTQYTLRCSRTLPSTNVRRNESAPSSMRLSSDHNSAMHTSPQRFLLDEPEYLEEMQAYLMKEYGVVMSERSIRRTLKSMEGMPKVRDTTLASTSLRFQSAVAMESAPHNAQLGSCPGLTITKDARWCPLKEMEWWHIMRKTCKSRNGWYEN